MTISELVSEQDRELLINCQYETYVMDCLLEGVRPLDMSQWLAEQG